MRNESHVESLQGRHQAHCLPTFAHESQSSPCFPKPDIAVYTAYTRNKAWKADGFL